MIDWCLENGIAEIAIGNVRDIADGKRLHRKSQHPVTQSRMNWVVTNALGREKLSNWAHPVPDRTGRGGRMRKYISYKAEAEGIAVFDNVNEKFTSQTCPKCGKRHTPRGRVFKCPHCGFVGVRDIVGAANIKSGHVNGKLAKVAAPSPKYRKPFPRPEPDGTGQRGLRSRVDTANLAWE